MSVVFGRRASWDDPELAALFETAEEFLELQQPGVNIVDAFPVLAKLPKFLQWWRPRGEKVHKKTVGYDPSPCDAPVSDWVVWNSSEVHVTTVTFTVFLYLASEVPVAHLHFLFCGYYSVCWPDLSIP
jgi:hypothetical protein